MLVLIYYLGCAEEQFQQPLVHCPPTPIGERSNMVIIPIAKHRNSNCTLIRTLTSSSWLMSWLGPNFGRVVQGRVGADPKGAHVVMWRRNCSIISRKGNVLILNRGRRNTSESLEGVGVHELELWGVIHPDVGNPKVGPHFSPNWAWPGHSTPILVGSLTFSGVWWLD